MPKVSCFLLVFLTSFLSSAGAVTDSIFYLHIDGTKFPLVYQERFDSAKLHIRDVELDSASYLRLVQSPWHYEIIPGRIDTGWSMRTNRPEITKDTIILRKSLVDVSPGGIGDITIRKPLHADTVNQINPVTLEEESVITPLSNYEVYFHADNIERLQLLADLKAGCIIENGQKNLNVKDIFLYYQTPTDCGWVTLYYPNPDDKILAKLAALKNGDFVIIERIETQGNFITEPIYAEALLELGSGPSRMGKFNYRDEPIVVPDSKPTIVDSCVFLSITPLQGITVYSGVNNKIRIAANGIPAYNIVPILEGEGTITVERDSQYVLVYNVNFAKNGRRKLNIEAVVNGTFKEIGSMELLVKRIPDPIPTISGKLRGGTLQKRYFNSQMGIVPLLENFDLEARFIVLSFEMIFSSHGKTQKIEVEGPQFNNEIMKAIEKAEPDDMIVFDGILVIGPDGQQRKLPPIVFTIIR